MQKMCKYCTHLQTGQEGRSREPQAHFSTYENHTASPLSSHFWVHEGEEGDWKQSAWIYHRQTNLIAFCGRMTTSGHEESTAGVTYSNFTEAFENIQVTRLRCYSLHEKVDV